MKVVGAIFYMHQTSGACAGVCTCDHTHQMDKTGFTSFVYLVFRQYMQLFIISYSQSKYNCNK